MATNPYGLAPEIQEIALSLGLGQTFGLTQPTTAPVKRPGFKTITLPDGSTREIPENPTADEKLQISLSLAQEFPDQYGELLDEYRDLGGYTAEFFKGIPRGLATGTLNIAQGAIGLVTPGVDTEAEKSLAALQGYIEEKSAVAADPVYRDTYAAKLGSGLGSFATFALPGAAAKVLGANPLGAATKYSTFGMAGASGAGEQSTRIMEQRELGKEISAGREVAALAPGLLIGFSEAVPVTSLFKKAATFDPAKGSALRNIFARIGKNSEVAGTLYDDVARLMTSAVKQGGIEGLQEAVAGVAQNAVSRVVYDPDIEIGGSMMDDLLVGGGVGALADVIVDAMGGRRTVANQAYRDRETQLRQKRIEDFEKARAERIAAMNKEAAENIKLLPPPPPRPEPLSPFDGVYTVSLANDPDRSMSVPVFTQDITGTVGGQRATEALQRTAAYGPGSDQYTYIKSGEALKRTFAYNPESNQYIDITENIAAGEDINSVLSSAMWKDIGSKSPSQVAVSKLSPARSISSAGVEADIASNRIAPISANVNVIPIPLAGGGAGGRFALVDIETGLPVADFSKADDEGGITVEYPSLEAAYKEMRSIDTKKKVIGVQDLLNSLGIPVNSGATSIGLSVANPEFRRFSGGFLSLFLPSEKRIGLKTDYSAEESKQLLGANAFNEMMQNASQLNDKNDQLGTLIPNVLEVNPQKRTITASKLKDLGKTKNLVIDPASKEFKTFAQYWTGTQKWEDMSNGQRLYLMSRISQITPFARQTKFPNLFARQYKQDQFDQTLALMGQVNEKGENPAVSVKDIEQITGGNKVAAQQIFDDLVYSRRVKPAASGKIRLRMSEEQYQQERQAEAANIERPFTPEPVEKPVSPEIQEVQDENAGVAAEAVAQGADPVNESVAEQFNNALTAALNKAGLVNLVKVRSETNKTKSLVGKTLPESVPAWFDPINQEIVVRMPEQLNRPDVTQEEIVDYVNQMINHEIIHVMREADLITEAEWNTLRNFVRTVRLDPKVVGKDILMGQTKDETLLDNVRRRYAKSREPMSEERILEEAVAEAYRLWNKHGGKYAAGKPQSIFKKILNYIKSFATAFKESGATNAEQIFSAIASGQVGQRTPGLSVFNPDAKAAIRSLRSSDLIDSGVMKKVRQENQKGGVKKFGSPKPEKKSISEVSAAISEGDQERVNEVLEDQIRNLPPGYIPRYNPNAPEAAILAAIEFENDGREPEMPLFAQSLAISAINNENVDSDIIEQGINKHARIKDDDRTWGQKTLDLLSGGTEDLGRWFRFQFVDKDNEFRRQETELIGTENERNLMAETSVSGALGMLDRIQGIMAALINSGGIRWVKGDRMVTNDAEISQDELAGYHEIDTSVPGLLNIFEKLQDNTVPNGMRQFKLYAMFKRIQGFRNRADIAREKLAQMKDELAPEDRRKLELAIDMEKKARLINNPSNEEISKTLEAIEGQYPDVVDAYNKYQDWNKTLIQFARDTQILTEEMAEQWKEWGDYFPFYKELEEMARTGGGYKRKSSLLRSDFLFEELTKDAKDLNEADPFEMIIKNASGVLLAGLRNVAALRIMRNSVLVDEARLISGPNPNKQASRIRENGGYTQTVLEEGRELIYEIADPLFYQSMMNFGEPALNHITKILAMPSSLLREMVTRDPGFIATNTFRDSISSWITSPVGFTPVIDSIRNWNSEEMEQLALNGIIGGYDASRDPKDLVKYVKNQYRLRGIDVRNHSINNTFLFTKLWDALGGLSQKSDGAARAAVYKRILKDTGSEAQARLAAIDVINFSRRGANPLWRSITAAVPFLNARVQGFDKIYTTLSGRYSPYDGLVNPEYKRNAIQKRALIRLGMITAMTGVYFVLMQDNEEYKKARKEVRDDNWLIPTGKEGVVIKLPIPYESGMIAKAIPEVFFNLMAGNLDARGARDSIVRQINNATNLDIFGFQIFKPIADIMQNKDSYTKEEIIPYWVDRGVDRIEQYDDRTTEIAKGFARGLNAVTGLSVSPMWIDYAANGYGGSLGTMLFLLADKVVKEGMGENTAGTSADWTDPNNLPVVRRFFINMGTSGSAMQQEFYELRDEVRKSIGTLNKMKKEGRVDEYLTYQASKRDILDLQGAVNSIDRYLKRYREYRKQIIDSDLPSDQKRALLKELEADKDLRLTVVPLLRDEANLPVKPVSAIFESFIG